MTVVTDDAAACGRAVGPCSAVAFRPSQTHVWSLRGSGACNQVAGRCRRCRPGGHRATAACRGTQGSARRHASRRPARGARLTLHRGARDIVGRRGPDVLAAAGRAASLAAPASDLLRCGVVCRGTSGSRPTDGGERHACRGRVRESDGQHPAGGGGRRCRRAGSGARRAGTLLARPGRHGRTRRCALRRRANALLRRTARPHPPAVGQRPTARTAARTGHSRFGARCGGRGCARVARHAARRAKHAGGRVRHSVGPAVRRRRCAATWHARKAATGTWPPSRSAPGCSGSGCRARSRRRRARWPWRPTGRWTRSWRPSSATWGARSRSCVRAGRRRGPVMRT